MVGARLEEIRMEYYACAHGNEIKFTVGKVDNEYEAAMECFGTTYRVTTMPLGVRKNRLRYFKQRKELMLRLAQLHKEKTGNDVVIR